MLLTKENLDKLVCQYEQQLNRLERDPKSIAKPVDDTWKSFRNRFYDIRRDDSYFDQNIELNHRNSCPLKCIHGHGYDFNTETICDDNCYDLRDNGLCPIHQICNCNRDADCECFDLCSVYTFATENFIRDKGVKQLIYEDANGKQFSNFWWGKHIPIDSDSYQLRYKRIKRKSKIYNLTISLNAIPILETNLLRLNRELIRQEAHRWSMANIRASRLLNSSWSVVDHTGNRVEIFVPNDIIIVICYYASF